MHTTSKTILCATVYLLVIPVSTFAQQVIVEKEVKQIVAKRPVLKKQSKAKPKKKAKEEKKIGLLKRIEKLDALIAKTTGQISKRNRKSEKILHILPESPYLGQIYSNSKYRRYLVIELKFLNKTAKNITLKSEDFQLKADDKLLKLKEIPASLSRYSFNDGKQSHRFKDFKVKESVAIAAGGEAKKTLLFTEIPGQGVIPDFTLTVKFKNERGKVQKQLFDLNLIEKARLKMTVERMGPGKCLGFIEIAGKLGSVNIGTFVKEIDTLNGKGVSRFVACWAKDAPPMDNYVNSWLQQQVYYMTSRNSWSSNNQFPALPGALHEFHLAGLPKNNNRNYYSSRNRKKYIHNTRYSALRAALKTSYESISATRVLEEVRNGHPLCRAIALDVSGYKLEKSQLPYILELSKNKKESDLQYAALKTLAHFNDRDANKRLLEVIALKDKKLSGIAVISLLSSRFAMARESLLSFFESAPEDQKSFVMEILIKHPNPQWSETIYQSMTKTENSITLEGLRSLKAMGHPKLLNLLAKAINSKNKKIQAEAVKQLVSRKDLASRNLTMDYLLESLKKDKVDSQAINLVKQTKDSRAVPLLLKHLKNSKSNRQAIILALGLLGDQCIAEDIAEIYPKLNGSEKSAALKILGELQSEHFLKFAEEALKSKNNSTMVRTAAQGLLQDGSDAAQKIMIAALANSKNRNTWSYLCNSLSQLGTVEAKKALIEARSSSDKNKSRYAINAINSMRSRSPGYRFKYQADQFYKAKKWSQAEKTFSLMIKLDDTIGESYTGRGKVYLAMKKPKQAYDDFRKGFERNPFDPEAVGYLAIFDLRRGKIERGLAFLKEHEKKFESSHIFYFLSARVYALAMANLRTKPKNPDREKRVKEYRKKTIALLKKAVKKGFRNYEKIKEEPDFKSLKNDADFKAIYNGKIEKKKGRKDKPAIRLGSVKAKS